VFELERVVQIITMVISVLGAGVVVWGVVEAVFYFVKLKVTAKERDDRIGENESLRQRLGAHLLLGLEVFIGADIISSVVSPSWDKVGILAAIVAIRTVLSYFLRMEIRQAQQ
jgi:uncharacterized membrane protein